MDSPPNAEDEDPERPMTPQEACDRMAKAAQEAMLKMDLVAEEKLRLYREAQLAVEACDRELEEKGRALQEIEAERLRKRQELKEELESLIRLKKPEAEMFQHKANEARQEAERLRSLALASKSGKTEQDYASEYLKRRLEEAEKEKQALIDKIKLQENKKPPQASGSGSGGNQRPPQASGSGGGGNQRPPQASGSGRNQSPPQASGSGGAGDAQMVQDLLKNARSVPPKSGGQ